MNELDTLSYSIQYHANTHLWSVNKATAVLCWFKTKEEAQDHLIKIFEMKKESL